MNSNLLCDDIPIEFQLEFWMKGSNMNSSAYITYGQMEKQAVSHYMHYGTKTSFKDIATHLFQTGDYQEGMPILPNRSAWSLFDDTTFYNILNELPVRNIFASESGIYIPSENIFSSSSVTNSDFSISAETIMPESLEVYAIKYIRDIIEKMHTHNFFEINYVFRGNCHMIFENETRELQEGELCIIAPHSRHDVTVTDDSIVVSLMLRKNTFETTFFKLLAQEDLLSTFFRNILYSHTENANYMLFVTDNPVDIRNAFKDIFMESHVRDSYSNTCVISRIHLLFSLLLRRYSTSIQFFENQKNPGYHANFTQILQYIQNHYQSLTLESLADTFHYNASYLSRLIKKHTGQTLVDILTNLKISKAADLLLHTNLKIGFIAKSVGYDNVDHFSRVFKKIYQVSPREYREQYNTR